MALNPLLPLAGIGALIFLLTQSKKSSAASPEDRGGPPPGSTTNSGGGALPPELLAKVQQALGGLGVNPATGQLTGAATPQAVAYGKAVADELKAKGFTDLSNTLMGYVSQAAAMLPGPYAPAPSQSTPVVSPVLPVGPKPTSDMSEAQRERMAQALGRLGVSPATGKLSGAADADAIRFASQVVGELEAAGFQEAAKALRAYVDEAAKGVKTPVEAAPVAQAAAAAGMTKEQAEYAARLLALERDPNKIGIFIDWLKKLAPSPQRDTFIQMAQALALQLEAANVTAQTLDKITEIVNLPDEEDEEPTAPAPVYTSTSPGQPTGKPPAAGAPLPSTPVAVPTTATPQPAPAALTDGEIVARNVATHLAAVQQKHGVKAAKGKEDKTLVKKFQALVGLTQDGAAGPATFILLAGKGAVNLPLVYYWPKTATAATVAEYRSSLEKIAKKMEENGRRDEANTLRVSIAREHGEGGINGALFGAPAAAAPKPAAAAPKPAAKPATATTTPAGRVVTLPETNITAAPAGVDPYPGQRVLKKGLKGEDVKRWQTALNNGGLSVGTADGDFGPKTDTQTRAFQKLAGLVADGAVGENTRKAARARAIW